MHKLDWGQLYYLMLCSRQIDEIEETRLMPERKVLYQFSARGHDFAQIALGLQLGHFGDAVGAYYRSRPILLALGLDLVDAFAGPMAKSGGFSDGRDIGVVCNLPQTKGVSVLPMSGDVGSQYTPIAGWAQALVYRQRLLKETKFQGAVAVVLGGEASVATNGFWSALTMSTTLKLPLLFCIEDNGFGISVPGHLQTPGANIADNLAAFKNLKVLQGSGTQAPETAEIIKQALDYVREWAGPCLLRLEVPRLSGHSGQDTQSYKGEKLIAEELARDPLPQVKRFLQTVLSANDISALEEKAKINVASALEKALQRPEPDVSKVRQHIFFETGNGSNALQRQGGIAPEGIKLSAGTTVPQSEPARINMLTAIRRTLEVELKLNQRVLVFGEDVGPKGGVHAATIGLQDTFGEERVFDTSLSEEGIIGRAVGMALCGLMPVAEIQFRKYADPATEQLNNCGTMRWRTANRFAAPIVVRIPGGYAKCGDPWHSVCDEVRWAHAPGWQVAFPSNAEDAVGLLRASLRSNNPTIFFEHRALLDGLWARRPYPGDDFILPFGRAKIIQAGTKITIVSWGAMLERCESAKDIAGIDAEIIDLRTISPWDKETVISSVKKTRRCLIVHEDGRSAGFGAEISAVLAEEAFFSLDAPIERVAVPDIPIPYNVALMNSILPGAEQIAQTIKRVVEN